MFNLATSIAAAYTRSQVSLSAPNGVVGDGICETFFGLSFAENRLRLDQLPIPLSVDLGEPFMAHNF